MIEDPVPELRRQLAKEIVTLASRTNFHVAAWALGVDTPRLSDLTHGRLERFSLNRLVRMLAMVDRRVELRVLPGPDATVHWFRRVGNPGWGRGVRDRR